MYALKKVIVRNAISANFAKSADKDRQSLHK